jgi:hypothetical protein
VRLCWNKQIRELNAGPTGIVKPGAFWLGEAELIRYPLPDDDAPGSQPFGLAVFLVPPPTDDRRDAGGAQLSVTHDTIRQRGLDSARSSPTASDGRLSPRDRWHIDDVDIRIAKLFLGRPKQLARFVLPRARYRDVRPLLLSAEELRMTAICNRTRRPGAIATVAEWKPEPHGLGHRPM